MLPEIERDHPLPVGRPVEGQIRHAGKLGKRIVHQQLFVLLNALKADCGDVGDRRPQPDNPAGIGRARLKTPRRARIGGAFRQANGGDHRSAPFPRRHRLQDIFFHVQYANPGRPIELVA